ncbi:hypothetical protein AB0F17_15655 [Nonomuraea sp. NPDC026600]
MIRILLAEDMYILREALTMLTPVGGLLLAVALITLAVGLIGTA